MVSNPLYLMMLSQELQRQRMREADHERLIRQVTRWEPSLAHKILVILRARWSDLWDGEDRSRRYPPISQTPSKSTSL